MKTVISLIDLFPRYTRLRFYRINQKAELDFLEETDASDKFNTTKYKYENVVCIAPYDKQHDTIKIILERKI